MAAEDIQFLKRCDELALEAAEKGNPAVGALIVRNGEILAQAAEAGRSKNDITCHAELEAIRFAIAKLQVNDLSDCVMYSSHEPCIMCAYAIRFYRIRKVVFKNYVPHLGGISSPMPLLSTAFVPPTWAQPPDIVHLPDSENYANS